MIRFKDSDKRWYEKEYNNVGLVIKYKNSYKYWYKIEYNDAGHITKFEDLLRNDIKFVNRQRGSGTRLLLDYNLKQLNINPNDISGYTREEYTHLAVAAAVDARDADVGLGVYSAAQ